MEKPMGRWGLVGTWLLVVTAVGSLTWFVIGRAVRDVGIVPVALPSSYSVAPPSSPSTPTPTTPEQSATEEDHPTPSPTQTQRPTSTPRQTTPAATTAPTVAPPVTRRATFSTRGGTVTASCTGTSIALVSATPNDGYRLYQQVKGGTLDVSFTTGSSGDGTDGEGIELRIVCQQGVPVQQQHD